MSNIIERFPMLCLNAQLKLQSFLDDESGDTNFISIIVVLGIALMVAGVFMGYKDQVIKQADTIIKSFVIK